MSNHVLKLATEPFEAIVSGRKTVESRLFDKKRQMIKLGDTITFINRENPEQVIEVRVIGLLRYKNFADMFEHNDPYKFGRSDREWLVDQIKQFYSLAEQEEYGVLGIEFKTI